MARAESDSPAAKALRKAGYGKAPSWWFTQAQLDVIERMGRGNLDEVNRVKDEAGDKVSLPYVSDNRAF